MGKHITAGVAGHVDHGKTSLVLRLTGTDTDRLKEEKRRGLSIEPGVAPLVLPSGRGLVLVDVPGHSDFLKNSIRGLAGVDMAVLVVAADDGVMPQTFNHLEVLRHSKARTGLVVLSKADLVDAETLELAALEIQEVVKGTFLEGRPVVPFSAADGRGLDDVVQALEAESARAEGKSLQSPFRFWIDQVRSFPGFGTVVSGTVLSGSIARDETVQLFPSGKEVKVRFLEVHHERVAQAQAGQRVGINLHKTGLREVEPGMVLAAPGTLATAWLLNTEFTVSRRAPAPLLDRQRVKFYLGTGMTQALAVTMEQPRLDRGETGLVQFRFSKPFAALPKDPFVISPMNLHTIIGGGTILEQATEKVRAVKVLRIVHHLQPLQRGDMKSIVDSFLLKFASRPLTIAEIARSTGFSEESIEREVAGRMRAGELLNLGLRGFFARERYEVLKEQLADTARKILSRDAFKTAAALEELKRGLDPSLDDGLLQRLAADLCRERRLEKAEGGYRVPHLVVSLSSEREKLASRLLEYARGLGYTTFAAGTFCKIHGKSFDQRQIQKLLDYLHGQNRLIGLNDGRFLTLEAMEEIREKVRDTIVRKGTLTLLDSKEILGYGRTRGIAVLEYLDSIGLTRRENDARVLASAPPELAAAPCAAVGQD
jgi:selenocysteine-specific elongation factor